LVSALIRPIWEGIVFAKAILLISLGGKCEMHEFDEFPNHTKGAFATHRLVSELSEPIADDSEREASGVDIEGPLLN
jgi:hypothetical protein